MHDLAEAARKWTWELARRLDLVTAALDAVARRIGRDPADFRSDWQHKSLADATFFWESICPLPESSPLRILGDLALRTPSPTPDQITGALLPGTPPKPFSLLRELISLAPEPLPSLWFTPAIDRNPADWFTDLAARLAEWAIALPALTLGVGIPAEAWDVYQKRVPESRTVALLREGIIAIPVSDVGTVQRRLSEAGIGSPAATAKVLVDAGATEGLLQAAVEAGQATASLPGTPTSAGTPGTTGTSETEENPEDRARSAAERLLFELLESLPQTAGLFELNGTLDFRFGVKWAEVDLLCRSRLLAIEVDGYYHFLNDEAYRRDRSKDFELQKRGYFVLRFLAKDVVDRLEQIRDRILEILSAKSSAALT